MEQPSYYSILTADVRYCKELKANEKLLYSEITALSNKHGYCHASNSYFAKLYGYKKGTISSWITHLKRLGFIKVIVQRDDNKVVLWRHIYPIANSSHIVEASDKNRGGLPYKNKGGILQKPKENNTSINTTRENTTSNKESIPYKEIIAYLNQKTGRNYHYQTKAYQTLIRARWKEGNTLKDFKTVIDNKAYDWQGTKYFAYMRPSTLFQPTKFDEYLNENNQNKPANNGGGYKNANNIGEDIPDSKLPF